MTSLGIVFILNIFVAGSVGVSALSSPKSAALRVFSNAYPPSELSRLVGALWIAIALVSIAGAIRPVTFSTVLVIQLIYKGLWLILVALPAFNTKYPYPRALAIFFAIWVFVLPFIIPWKTLFA